MERSCLVICRVGSREILSDIFGDDAFALWYFRRWCFRLMMISAMMRLPHYDFNDDAFGNDAIVMLSPRGFGDDAFASWFRWCFRFLVFKAGCHRVHSELPSACVAPAGSWITLGLLSAQSFRSAMIENSICICFNLLEIFFRNFFLGLYIIRHIFHTKSAHFWIAIIESSLSICFKRLGMNFFLFKFFLVLIYHQTYLALVFGGFLACRNGK